jgi:hypothetical protein
MLIPNPNVTGWDIDVAQSEKGRFFSKNTIVRILIGVNVFFVLASFGILSYFIRSRSGLFVINYNVYFGVEIEGVWWQIFIFPAVSIFFLLGHFFLALRFYELRERIAAYLMLFGSCLISIGVLISSIGIAFINY